MTTKNFFLAETIIALAFGIPLLIMPEPLINMYASSKIDMSPILDTVARGYGTLLTGIGVAYYYIRNADSSLARRGFLVISMVGNSLATFVHIRAIMQGTENALAWSIVVLVAGLSIWSFMLYNQDKDSTSS